MSEAILSLHQLAEYLNVHPSTLYRMLKKGGGPPSFKVGSDHRFRREAVEAWMKKQERGD